MLHHSTLGSRVIKKIKKERDLGGLGKVDGRHDVDLHRPEDALAHLEKGIQTPMARGRST